MATMGVLIDEATFNALLVLVATEKLTILPCDVWQESAEKHLEAIYNGIQRKMEAKAAREVYKREKLDMG